MCSKNASRNWQPLAWIMFIVLSSMLIVWFCASTGKKKQLHTIAEESSKAAGNENPATNTEEEQKTPQKEPSFPSPIENHLVTRVSDGDTLYVEGYSVRARLIGINTPEVYNTDTAEYTCYGPEASEYVKNLLLGKYVGVETDTNAGSIDSFGRPLLYIYYQGKNVNYELIRLGYARENDYGGTYKYKEEFVAAQEEAKQNQRGLWSPNTCNGN